MAIPTRADGPSFQFGFPRPADDYDPFVHPEQYAADPAGAADWVSGYFTHGRGASGSVHVHALERRTPARDRLRTALDRHYLEREMAEREREDLARRVQRSVSFRVRRPPPLPPYQHAPAYDDVVAEGEDAAMVCARAATPSRAEFPPPDEPPPPAAEAGETAGETRIDERRRSGDSRHATGADLV